MVDVPPDTILNNPEIGGNAIACGPVSGTAFLPGVFAVSSPFSGSVVSSGVLDVSSSASGSVVSSGGFGVFSIIAFLLGVLADIQTH